MNESTQKIDLDNEQEIPEFLLDVNVDLTGPGSGTCIG